jgi:hypothetical protein
MFVKKSERVNGACPLQENRCTQFVGCKTIFLPLEQAAV